MSSVYMIVFTVGLAVQILAAATECEEGAVKLEPLLDMKPYEGYVQHCINNQWRGLCGNTFSRVDANVVCRQLGYSDEGAIKDGNVENKTAWTNLSFSLIRPACAGRENTLAQCNLNLTSDSDCSKYRWVKCLKADCTTGSLRLVGGASYREGRVEVCVDGRWGTVCYNEELAGTVCQQLGFGSQGAIANHTNIPVPKVNCTTDKTRQGSEDIFQQGMCEALFVQCNKRNENCSSNETSTENISIEHSILVCTTLDSGTTSPPITSEPTTTMHATTNNVDNTNNNVCNTTQQTPSVTTDTVDSINTEQPTCTCPTTRNYNTDQAGGTSNTTLGVLIGLLALLEIATVIGCILCILRRKTTPLKPPRARGTSFINESYETNPPVQSEYSTVGPHYDALKRNEPPKIETSAPAHPPPVGGVGDDEFYNAEDHTYAVVTKKDKVKKQEGGVN